MATSAFAEDARPTCPDGTVLVHEPRASGCQLKGESGTARHGIWTFWYADGSKREERPYWNGKLHGLRSRWDARGRGDGMECFIDGERRRLEACSHVKFAYEPLPQGPAQRAPAGN